MKKNLLKCLSLVLCMAMCLGMCGTTAFATEENQLQTASEENIDAEGSVEADEQQEDEGIPGTSVEVQEISEININENTESEGEGENGSNGVSAASLGDDEPSTTADPNGGSDTSTTSNEDGGTITLTVGDTYTITPNVTYSDWGGSN